MAHSSSRNWLPIPMALAGTAALALHPGAGVAVTLVAVVVAGARVPRFNARSTQLAFAVTAVAHAFALAVVTRSVLAATAALVALLATCPFDEVVRTAGYRLIPNGLWLSALCAGALAASWPGAWGLAVVPSIALLALPSLKMLPMVRSLAKRRRAPGRLAPGEPAPDFTLPDRQGRPFTLHEHRGQHVLVVFLIGDWCPLCHVKMRLYEKERARLAAEGCLLVTITETSGPSGVKFAADMGLGGVMLYDEGCQVAERYGARWGAAFQGRDMPLPSSFLVDPDGIVTWTSPPHDLNSFVEPTEVLEVLRRAAPARAAAA